MSSSAGALAVLGLRLYGGARLQQQFDHLRVATFCRAQEWRKTSGSSDELWTRTGLDSTGATALGAPAEFVRVPHGGARLQQQLDHLNVAFSGRQVKRRLA